MRRPGEKEPADRTRSPAVRQCRHSGHMHAAPRGCAVPAVPHDHLPLERGGSCERRGRPSPQCGDAGHGTADGHPLPAGTVRRLQDLPNFHRPLSGTSADEGLAVAPGITGTPTNWPLPKTPRAPGVIRRRGWGHARCSSVGGRRWPTSDAVGEPRIARSRTGPVPALSPIAPDGMDRRPPVTADINLPLSDTANEPMDGRARKGQ